jgi:ankyrin repeat protein
MSRYAGRTPLLEAANGDDRKKPVVELLLDRGAKINVKDDYGNTPLHLAAEHDAPGIVGILLGRGADPQIRNNEGKLALDVATSHNKTEIVALLNAANPKN